MDIMRFHPQSVAFSVGVFPGAPATISREKHIAPLGIVMERNRFAELTEQLETVHLICPEQKICSHVFPTTSEIRLVLQHLVDCPPERKLRKIYLEGKVLELLSLFCDEVVGKQSGDKEISREDYRCLQKAREMIDHHFLHPLTIQQIAQGVFFKRNEVKAGLQNLFQLHRL